MTPNLVANRWRVEAGVLQAEARAMAGCVIDLPPLAEQLQHHYGQAEAARLLQLAHNLVTYNARELERQARGMLTRAERIDPLRQDGAA